MTAQGNQGDGFGRVDADGTVYVRIGDEEKVVGQYPEGTPEEALAFYTRRFEGLEFEVHLLEQRVRTGAMSPDEATASIKKVADQLQVPNAVGDFTGLSARLNALKPIIGIQREKRREERAQKVEESRTRTAAIVAEAEKIAAGTDWRNGANRLRDLLAEWKELPRLEKAADDELWHRFSGARTTYTRARKAHFAVVSEQREGARVIKERLAKEAEALADSTDWGGTAAKQPFRDISERWDAAGKVPRDQIKSLEARIRKVEQEIRGLEDAQWKKSDPEKSARADGMVGQLEDAIAKIESDLEKARAAGDARKVKDLEENLASRRAFLEMAKQTASEFS